jgi:hypothetical protein
MDLDEAQVCRVPIAFRHAVARLNEDVLPARGERLIYQGERQCWRLVKLAKGDPLTVDQVKDMARKLGAVSDDETIID